jgi:hypothetical protein
VFLFDQVGRSALIPDCCVLVVAEGSMGKIDCIQFVLTMMLDVRRAHSNVYPTLRGIHGPLYPDLFKNPPVLSSNPRIFAAPFKSNQLGPTVKGLYTKVKGDIRRTTYDPRHTTHGTRHTFGLLHILGNESAWNCNKVRRRTYGIFTTGSFRDPTRLFIIILPYVGVGHSHINQIGGGDEI